MKSFSSVVIIYFLLFSVGSVFAQGTEKSKVIVTGVRFAYPLLQQWIDRYEAANPGVDIIIESRNITDPAQYDLLIEAYEQDSEVKSNRDYLYIGRYAILLFANATSDLARLHGSKGLTTDQVKSIFFHDVLAEHKDVDKLPVSLVYTRLQKAGAPTTFSKFYGYSQAQIKGKAIGGADEHLIKAVQRDSAAVSYASINLLFDQKTKALLPHIKIIPVDLDGNKKITDDERTFTTLREAVELIESTGLKNIPVEHIHISLHKINKNPEAIRFVQWLAANGQEDLHEFGFLLPDQSVFENEKEKFEERARKQ